MEYLLFNSRIDLLIEQNRELAAQLETLNHGISEKQEEARRLKNKNKGLSSLLGNKSEKQIPLAKEEPLSLTPLISRLQKKEEIITVSEKNTSLSKPKQ